MQHSLTLHLSPTTEPTELLFLIRENIKHHVGAKGTNLSSRPWCKWVLNPNPSSSFRISSDTINPHQPLTPASIVCYHLCLLMTWTKPPNTQSKTPTPNWSMRFISPTVCIFLYECQVPNLALVSKFMIRSSLIIPIPCSQMGTTFCFLSYSIEISTFQYLFHKSLNPSLKSDHVQCIQSIRN